MKEVVQTTFPHLHGLILAAEPSVIGQVDSIEQKSTDAWQDSPEDTVHPVWPHKHGAGLSAVPFVLLQSGAAMQTQNLETELSQLTAALPSKELGKYPLYTKRLFAS